MWEIFQQDLRHCLQNLNQMLITWKIEAPNTKAVAEIINQLQKLVAGGLLLQAEDLVGLVKKVQVFIEEHSLNQTLLTADEGDVLHRISIEFEKIANSEDAQQEYIASKEIFNVLLLSLEADLPSSALASIEEEVAVSQVEKQEVLQAPISNTKQSTNQSDSLNTIDIFDIFTKELQIGVNLLIDCVLKIEQGTVRISDYTEMMRCAHSLKGGARLAGLNHVVTLAHNLEDIFTKVQNGDHSFKSNDIDILMQLIDLFQPLSSVDTNNPDSGNAEALLAKSDQLFQVLLTNSGQEILETPTEESLLKAPAKEPEIVDQIVQSTFASSEEHLQNIISIVSDMKIDAQLSFQMMNEFRHLYRELSIFGHDFNSEKASTSGDELSFDAKEKLKNFRQTMQNCRHLFEKFDLFTVENKNKIAQLSSAALSCRMGPFEDSLVGISRLVRDLSKSQKKDVNLAIIGAKTPVDRNILKELGPVLIHLIQNAIDHGISLPQERLKQNKPAQASLKISAQHRSGHLIINVADDGNGIDLTNIRAKVVERKMVAKNTVNNLSDEELLSFIFLPQFTLKEEVTQVSGRGVGLDVVHNFITKFHGKLKVNNHYGQGVDFEFRLPVSMATLRCVIFRIEKEFYAVPVYQIEHVVSIDIESIYYIEGKAAFHALNTDVFLFNGKDTLGLDGAREGVPSTVIILKSAHNHFGFMVNEIIDELELVDRPLPPGLGKLKDVRTASALPDGTPILILDVEDLVTNIEKIRLSVTISEMDEQHNNAHKKKKILVVDDSLTIREVQRNMLEAQGYTVDVAVDGVDGWNHLRQNTYHLLITDIDMPRLNGWELLEKVKNHSVLNKLPVIIVSYKDNEGDFERGLQAGADSYISKGSFQDDSFIQTVNELLGYPSSHELSL